MAAAAVRVYVQQCRLRSGIWSLNSDYDYGRGFSSCLWLVRGTMGCMVNVKKAYNYTQNSIVYLAFFSGLSTSAANLGNFHIHVRVSMHETNKKKDFFDNAFPF